MQVYFKFGLVSMGIGSAEVIRRQMATFNFSVNKDIATCPQIDIDQK